MKGSEEKNRTDKEHVTETNYPGEIKTSACGGAYFPSDKLRGRAAPRL